MCGRIRIEWWRGVVGVCIFALGSSCFGQEPPFECFAVTDLVRVFEDGYHCPAPQKQIEVFGIRNEVLSAQCVVKAGQPLRDLTVSVSPLKHKTANAALPADSVTWNFIGSILLAENSPNHRKSDVIRAAPARFPDYLSDVRQMAVETGQCRAVYLTIRITINGTEVPVAEDGLFLENVSLPSRGTITVEARQQNARKQIVRHFQPRREPAQLTLTIKE